jgi:hypothetical protein
MGQAVVGSTGKYLRHPFTGVASAQRFDLPDKEASLNAGR